jgi:GTP-binding protein
MKHQSCQIVALIGRPNVGKSSLFNRLTRSNKAIVEETPGVTRDRHYEKVFLEEKTFILVDTGGVESTGSDNMGTLIGRQAEQAIEEADILLFVLDGRQGLTSEDLHIAGILRKCGKTVLCLVNKVDTPEQETRLLPQFFELGFEQFLPVSASHGYGIKEFLTKISQFISATSIDRNLPENTISIACIGRPNVGKSSLINRLLGEDRMVVSDIPGTTRDSVDTLLQRKEENYLLIDTAGIRRKGKVRDKLEKFSVMRALSAMENCDITFLLIDAAEGVTEQDTKVIGYALERGRACLILINKWDLVNKDLKRQKYLREQLDRATRFVNYAPVLHISALTGMGTAKIFSMVNQIFHQYESSHATHRLNAVLQKAVEGHPPPLYKGRRIKLYYTTQVSSKPPAFVIFCNYPKGIHFSYYRYLVNQFREGLQLDKAPLKIILRERQRKKYS